MAYGLTQSATITTTPHYFSIADNASLSPTGSFSIECWVKFATLPTSGNTMTFVAKRNGSGNQRSYWFYMQNVSGTYTLGAQFSSDGASPFDVLSNSGISPVTGTWYHVGVTFTTGTGAVQFELNGSSAGTGTSSPKTIFDGTSDLQIGNRFEGGSGDPLDGQISLVRLWKGEARSLANLSANMCNVLGSTTNLSAEWTLNNVLTDNSGNSNTLTNNSVAFTSDVPATCVTVAVNSNFLAFM